MANHQELQIDSEIVQAYIYPPSAKMIRKGKLKLEQGLYSIIFGDILESFNGNSIRVELRNSVDAGAGINGVSVATIFWE